MRAYRIFAAIVALLSMMVSAMAQDGTYRLQPEDVIRIQVYREGEVAAELSVGRDGNITAPFLGIVRAAGKTTTELAAELEAAYAQKLRLRDPKVSVVLLAYRQIRAAVVGFATRPDVYALRPGDTLLTLLSRAGGPVVDRADLRRVWLRKGATNELIPIDLHAMLIQADLSQNYSIEDGDELNIPEKQKPIINVIGMVPQPGPMIYREGMTVADALSFARWSVPHRSMLSKTLIVREMPGNPGKYMHIQVDMVRFIDKRDSQQNIELHPGDLVWVPNTKTPDFDRLASIAGTFFYLNRFFTDDVFGFRIFGR